VTIGKTSTLFRTVAVALFAGVVIRRHASGFGGIADSHAFLLLPELQKQACRPPLTTWCVAFQPEMRPAKPEAAALPFEKHACAAIAPLARCCADRASRHSNPRLLSYLDDVGWRSDDRRSRMNIRSSSHPNHGD
jgi:hypothetical protein